MALEQALLLWVHLTSAAVWVGGSLFLGVVLAPVLKRTSMTTAERISMMILVGRRFNWVAIPALATLIITGMYASRGFIGQPELLDASNYGMILVVKSALVAALITIFAVHVWMIRGSVESRINAGKMGPEELGRLRKKIIILGEAMVVISVLILFLAALLDSGA